MKSIELSLRSGLAQLVWTIECLESRKKSGSLSWAESRAIDQAIAALLKTKQELMDVRVSLFNIKDVTGHQPGGLVHLSERGKIEYTPVLGPEVDSDLMVLEVKPLLVVSPSGVRCYLSRCQIKVE